MSVALALLKERINWAGWLSICLGLAGASLMLYKPELGAPMPQNTAEWAGLAAGLSSAMLNIAVKKTPEMPSASRTFF